MNYFISRNDEQAGPFTMNQLKGMWTTGQITSETRYWADGLPEWRPLGGLIESEINQEKKAQYPALAGWSVGRTILHYVLMVVFPPISLIIGLYALFNRITRKQGAILIGATVVYVVLGNLLINLFLP